MSAAKKTKPINDDLWFLSIKDVCERSTYGRKAIEKFIREGKLKAEKLNNGKRVVQYKDFAAFMESIKTHG